MSFSFSNLFIAALCVYASLVIVKLLVDRPIVAVASYVHAELWAKGHKVAKVDYSTSIITIWLVYAIVTFIASPLLRLRKDEPTKEIPYRLGKYKYFSMSSPELFAYLLYDEKGEDEERMSYVAVLAEIYATIDKVKER